MKSEKNEMQEAILPMMEHICDNLCVHPKRTDIAEEELKVYLCLEHHREGPEAVHRNHDMMRLVQQEGQQAFHLTYPEIDFRKEFGKNYLGEDKSC